MSALRPPPAPSKTRRAAPARAAKPPAPASPPDVNTLAADLAQLQVDQPQRAQASTSRSAARAPRAAPPVRPLGRSTAANRSTAPPPAASTAAKVRLAPARSKELAQDDGRTPAERARDAMKAVNAALSSLAALKESGFRATTAASSSATAPSSSASTPSSRSSSAVRPASSSSSLRAGAAQNATRDKVEQAARDAARALRELRALAAEGVLGRKRVDVEKAAGGVVAHLVEMGLVRPLPTLLRLVLAGIDLLTRP